MNNKFWLFERKHYFPIQILTNWELSLFSQLFPPTCNHQFRTSSPTWEMYHHSFPLQTWWIPSIWQEALPKAGRQPGLTQWHKYCFNTLITKLTPEQEAVKEENCHCMDGSKEGGSKALASSGLTGNRNHKMIQRPICGACLLVKSN